MSHTLLIVDDEEVIRNVVRDMFEDDGFTVFAAESGEKALKILSSNEVEAVILDVWMDKMDGLETLAAIKKINPDLPVIMLSGHANISAAVKATKIGAFDFVEKPPDYDKLLMTVGNAIKQYELQKENHELRSRVELEQPEIVGKSEPIRNLLSQLESIAPSDGWVLIQGENGTGKEVVARQIHSKSNRSKKPFVEVNCAAIPEELIESELFGHEKGAFTGAHKSKQGKFDKANKGTLFLDEIGDMSPKTQAKVLRILQEQRFERVGGNDTIHVDVRIIAATNKDMIKEIELGNFREDLYYRLNVLPLFMPPLRERTGDIPILLKHFLEYFIKNKSYKRKVFHPSTIDYLLNYKWPGNIRELKNIVERMLIMTAGDEIRVEHIPLAIRVDVERNSGIDGKLSEIAQNGENDIISSAATLSNGSHDPESVPEEETGNLSHNNDVESIAEGMSFKEARMEFEKNFVLRILDKCEWNSTEAAGMMGLEKSNFYKKLKQLGIEISK